MYIINKKWFQRLVRIPISHSKNQQTFDVFVFQFLEQRLVNPLVNKKVVIIREEQLTIGKLLGEGNFGKVYAGEYREEHGKVVSFECLLIYSSDIFEFVLFSGSSRYQSIESKCRFSITRRNEKGSIRNERIISSMYCSSLWCFSIEKIEQYLDGI